MTLSPRTSTLIDLTIVGLLGAIYGFVIQLLFSVIRSDFFHTVSLSFLAFMPFGMGAIAVYVASKNAPLSRQEKFLLPWIPVLVLLGCAALLNLEGSICLIIATPIFLLMASAGGLIMGAIQAKRAKRNTLMSIALLPMALSPIEIVTSPTYSPQWVVTTRIINATPEAIWPNIVNAPNIKKSELGFSYSHAMGFPKPLSADMNDQGIGALRTSTWEKGVVFGERITQWEPPQLLTYEFEIDPARIPMTALDQHVQLGGRYGSVIKGGYKLTPLNANQTLVELKTQYINRTSWLLPYTLLWSDFILDDFHQSILHLVQTRSE